MNRRNKAAVTMGVLALTALSLTAWAKPGGRPAGEAPGPFGGGGPGLGRMLENEQAIQRLGLSADQVSALQARLADAEKTLIKLRAEVQLAEAEVRNLMRKDVVDRAAVMKAVDAAGAAHLALRKAMIEERLAFREIAGPDAAKKARQHFAQHRRDGGAKYGPGGRGERFERRGPPPFEPDAE